MITDTLDLKERKRKLVRRNDDILKQLMQSIRFPHNSTIVKLPNPSKMSFLALAEFFSQAAAYNASVIRARAVEVLQIIQESSKQVASTALEGEFLHISRPVLIALGTHAHRFKPRDEAKFSELYEDLRLRHEGPNAGYGEFLPPLAIGTSPPKSQPVIPVTFSIAHNAISPSLLRVDIPASSEPIAPIRNSTTSTHGESPLPIPARRDISVRKLLSKKPRPAPAPSAGSSQALPTISTQEAKKENEPSAAVEAASQDSMFKEYTREASLFPPMVMSRLGSHDMREPTPAIPSSPVRGNSPLFLESDSDHEDDRTSPQADAQLIIPLDGLTAEEASIVGPIAQLLSPELKRFKHLGIRDNDNSGEGPSVDYSQKSREEVEAARQEYLKELPAPTPPDQLFVEASGPGRRSRNPADGLFIPKTFRRHNPSRSQGKNAVASSFSQPVLGNADAGAASAGGSTTDGGWGTAGGGWGNTEGGWGEASATSGWATSETTNVSGAAEAGASSSATEATGGWGSGDGGSWGSGGGWGPTNTGGGWGEDSTQDSNTSNANVPASQTGDIGSAEATVGENTPSARRSTTDGSDLDGSQLTSTFATASPNPTLATSTEMTGGATIAATSESNAGTTDAWGAPATTDGWGTPAATGGWGAAATTSSATVPQTSGAAAMASEWGTGGGWGNADTTEGWGAAAPTPVNAGTGWGEPQAAPSTWPSGDSDHSASNAATEPTNPSTSVDAPFNMARNTSPRRSFAEHRHANEEAMPLPDNGWHRPLGTGYRGPVREDRGGRRDGERWNLEFDSGVRARHGGGPERTGTETNLNAPDARGAVEGNQLPPISAGTNDIRHETGGAKIDGNVHTASLTGSGTTVSGDTAAIGGDLSMTRELASWQHKGDVVRSAELLFSTESEPSRAPRSPSATDLSPDVSIWLKITQAATTHPVLEETALWRDVLVTVNASRLVLPNISRGQLRKRPILHEITGVVIPGANRVKVERMMCTGGVSGVSMSVLVVRRNGLASKQAEAGSSKGKGPE